MSWETQNNTEEKKETKEVKKIEFKSLKDSIVNRGIKILSYGSFSTGKTHFALTSTKPVFIIDTENGASPLADKFPDAQVINICNIEGEDVDEKDEVRNFENFQDAVNQLIKMKDEEIETIIIDSISDVWSWVQAYAKTKVFKIPIEDRFKQQFDWGVPNSLMRKNVLKLINKNCNIIFTAREGEIYDGPGQPSGRYKPEVQKKIPFYVDLVLHHEIRYLNKNVVFQAKIEKCRQKGELIGKIIENPNMDKIKELLKGGQNAS
jgi:hypothetical protein